MQTVIIDGKKRSFEIRNELKKQMSDSYSELMKDNYSNLQQAIVIGLISAPLFA